MNKAALLEQIKEKARQDAEKRRDCRFLDTMGFLVAKGFLRTNIAIPMQPNRRLYLHDAIWAGMNVEPRILEVLPAAVLRLGKHFHIDPAVHEKGWSRELIHVVDQLRRREEKGDIFCGIPYEKVKVWAELPLKDGRVKSASKKKIMKTFRLDPAALECLKKAAGGAGCTETEILERMLLGHRS